MAINRVDLIQFLTGPRAAFDALTAGGYPQLAEPVYASDTGELGIGNGPGSPPSWITIQTSSPQPAGYASLTEENRFTGNQLFFNYVALKGPTVIEGLTDVTGELVFSYAPRFDTEMVFNYGVQFAAHVDHNSAYFQGNVNLYGSTNAYGYIGFRGATVFKVGPIFELGFDTYGHATFQAGFMSYGYATFDNGVQFNGLPNFSGGLSASGGAVRFEVPTYLYGETVLGWPSIRTTTASLEIGHENSGTDYDHTLCVGTFNSLSNVFSYPGSIVYGVSNSGIPAGSLVAGRANDLSMSTGYSVCVGVDQQFGSGVVFGSNNYNRFTYTDSPKVAFGQHNNLEAGSSTVVGLYNNINGEDAHVFGYLNDVSSSAITVIGQRNCTWSGSEATVVGQANRLEYGGWFSAMFGYSNRLTVSSEGLTAGAFNYIGGQTRVVAMGFGNSVVGSKSIVVGIDNNVADEYGSIGRLVFGNGVHLSSDNRTEIGLASGARLSGMNNRAWQMSVPNTTALPNLSTFPQGSHDDGTLPAGCMTFLYSAGSLTVVVNDNGTRKKAVIAMSDG